MLIALNYKSTKSARDALSPLPRNPNAKRAFSSNILLLKRLEAFAALGYHEARA